MVPKVFCRDVLLYLHNSRTSGHLGVTRTLSKLRNNFHWIYCGKDVEEWCRKCDACAKRKGLKGKSRSLEEVWVKVNNSSRDRLSVTCQPTVG